MYRASPRDKIIFFSHPEPNTGCFLWGGSIFASGYGLVHFNGKNHRAHRVVWRLANGPIPKGMEVCHRCDIPWCVNIDHLFWGTHSDNMKDRLLKGRYKTKLNNLEVSAIKLDDRTRKEIAAEYGISYSTVRDIKSGRRREYVP